MGEQLCVVVAVSCGKNAFFRDVQDAADVPCAVQLGRCFCDDARCAAFADDAAPRRSQEGQSCFVRLSS
jgi:hypothetical protein